MLSSDVLYSSFTSFTGGGLLFAMNKAEGTALLAVRELGAKALQRGTEAANSSWRVHVIFMIGDFRYN